MWPAARARLKYICSQLLRGKGILTRHLLSNSIPYYSMYIPIFMKINVNVKSLPFKISCNLKKTQSWLNKYVMQFILGEDAKMRGPSTVFTFIGTIDSAQMSDVRHQ